MLSFKEIELKDKPLFDRYTARSGLQHCDIAFANLYFYRSYWLARWVEHEGFLLLRLRIGRHRRLGYMAPLGEGDWLPLLPVLAEDAASAGEPLRLFNCSPQQAASLQQSPWGEKLYCYANRDYADYLYLRESLATLSGVKLQPKRNHVNKFMRLYRYRTEPLTAAHYREVRTITSRWSSEKRARGEEVVEGDLVREEAIIRDSFLHFDALGLRGLMLYVEDRPVAFTYGSPINDETFDVHIEKADTNYEGVFSMINRLFAASLPEHYRYINREDDLGLPGLRRSKLSYHPLRIVELWHAVERTSEEGRLWQLWQRCFPDEQDAFLSYYLFHYSLPETRLLHFEAQELVGMIHFHLFRTRFAPVGYFYALGVDPAFRGRGIARQLVERLLRRHRAEGVLLECCIPASEELARWYEQRFSLAATPCRATVRLHTADSCDLGTGDPAANHAFWRVLRAEAYLRAYLREYPQVQVDFMLQDSLFPEQDGRYRSEQGRICFTPGQFPGAASPAALYTRYPLFDPDLIFER